MKLVELKLTNYRAYREETAISFEDLFRHLAGLERFV